MLKVLADKFEEDRSKLKEQQAPDLRQRREELDYRKRVHEVSQAPRLPIIPKITSEKD